MDKLSDSGQDSERGRKSVGVVKKKNYRVLVRRCVVNTAKDFPCQSQIKLSLEKDREVHSKFFFGGSYCKSLPLSDQILVVIRVMS
jgi:hypothetical protein